MLSEKERAWLEQRNFPCPRCKSINNSLCRWADNCLPIHTHTFCGPLFNWKLFDIADDDLRDAAEFEARVAARAVKMAALMCGENADDLLRSCRLAVETNMDKEI